MRKLSNCDPGRSARTSAKPNLRYANVPTARTATAANIPSRKFFMDSFFPGFLELLQHVFGILIGGIPRQSFLVILLSLFKISRLHVRFREAVPDVARLWKFRRIQPEDLNRA